VPPPHREVCLAGSSETNCLSKPISVLSLLVHGSVEADGRRTLRATRYARQTPPYAQARGAGGAKHLRSRPLLPRAQSRECLENSGRACCRRHKNVA